MTDQELDNLMRNVLLDIIKSEFSELGNTDAFKPSPNYQKQMHSMTLNPLRWLRKKSRPVWKKAIQQVAIVFLIISIGFSGVMVVSTPARAAVIRWIMEWYETHIVYRFTGENYNVEMPKYEISDLPEDYIEYEREESADYCFVSYINKEKESMIFLSYMRMEQGNATGIIIDDVSIESVTINGSAGELYIPQDPIQMESTIIWIDSDRNLQFTIDGILSKEELIHIAESVSEKNKKF